jgi:FkbM family methyltransferase
MRNKDINTIYDTMLAENKTPLIIDAGANIGASVIWFYDQFPKSHLIAFEPEENNFNILKKNTAMLGIECKQVAIGSINSHACISNINLSENWAFQTNYDSKGPIQVMSVQSIIEESPVKNLQPFIIKIDIEGFENDLFSKNIEWIDNFYVIIIDLHDWMLPKQGTSKNFLTSITGKDRNFIQKDENIFSIQN